MGKYKAKVSNNNKSTNKPKKIKETKLLSDNQIELRRLIIIFVITIVFIIGVYFLTVFILNKRNAVEEETTKGTINYNTLAVGTLLNRPYDNYYVLVYDSTSNKGAYYDSIFQSYVSNENGKKIYSCDLSSELNKKYIANDGKSNPGAKVIEDLKFGEVTLIEVKNRQIVNYIENIDSINNLLK